MVSLRSELLVWQLHKNIPKYYVYGNHFFWDDLGLGTLSLAG